MKLPKWIIRRVTRAVIEFDMLSSGDRVLVGLSGGKDSAFLLCALAVLKEQVPFQFDLAAFHVDQGFEAEFDGSPMAELCETLGIPFHLRRTSIFQAAFNHARQNPCAQCAYLRRAFVNDFAVKNNFNKVALAHHQDDAIETFLMSQLYAGQVKTFQPTSFLDRTGVTVIRPLVYFRELEIKQAGKLLPFTPVDTPCPMAGRSKRAVVKEMIKNLTRDNRYIYDNLVAAMREGAEIRRWTAVPSDQLLKEKAAQFWGQQGKGFAVKPGNKEKEVSVKGEED